MVENTCNAQQDTSNSTTTGGTPKGPSTPYVRPTAEESHQDWPIDPEVRARIVAGFEAMTKPGATVTYRTRKGEMKTVPVKPREALGAVKVLTGMARNALEQQCADYEALQHNNDMTLNDLVSPVLEVIGPRLEEETKRQGLSSSFELDDDTVRTISEGARKDYEDEHGPLPEKGPTPFPETPPEQRSDWIIPASTQRNITRRLQQMLDPVEGVEYHTLRPRERVMAGRVLGMVERLVKEQQRWDRFVKAGKPIDQRQLEFPSNDN